MRIDVNVVELAEHPRLCVHIPNSIFENKGVARSTRWDEDDHTATHFLDAMLKVSQLVAARAALATDHIGRGGYIACMAWQRSGERLMRESDGACPGPRMSLCCSRLRVQAQGLYQRLDLIVCSAPYLEAGHYACGPCVGKMKAWILRRASDRVFSSPGTFTITTACRRQGGKVKIDLPYQLGPAAKTLFGDKTKAMRWITVSESCLRRGGK